MSVCPHLGNHESEGVRACVEGDEHTDGGEETTAKLHDDQQPQHLHVLPVWCSRAEGQLHHTTQHTIIAFHLLELFAMLTEGDSWANGTSALNTITNSCARNWSCQELTYSKRSLQSCEKTWRKPRKENQAAQHTVSSKC